MLDLDELEGLKRTKTHKRGRGSIFVPKKTNRRIDISGASPEAHQSDDDDRDLKRNTSNDSLEGRFSLKQYNKDRKARLAKFDLNYQKEEEEEEETMDTKVSMANKLQLNCFGNLEVSLFWEEKFAVLMRIAQLYTVLFVFYYE